MSREGDHYGLLDELHVQGCDQGTEYSACRAVPVVDWIPPGRVTTQIEVVYMAWCSDCGAADYEVV